MYFEVLDWHWTSNAADVSQQLFRNAGRGTGHALGLSVCIKEACKDKAGEMFKDCLRDMYLTYHSFNNPSDMLQQTKPSSFPFAGNQ